MKNPGLLEKRKALIWLSSSEIHEENYSNIKRKVWMLFQKFRVSTHIFSPGYVVYRASRTPSRPCSISRLAEPPAAKIEHFGRCNKPGFPVFYCSNTPTIALKEIGAEAHETLYLSRWIVRRPMMIGDVHGVFFKTESNASTKVSKEILQFFTDEFVKTVDRHRPNAYKVTAAISSMVMDGKTVGVLPHNSLAEKARKYLNPTLGIGAHAYVSVLALSDPTAINIAIHPKIRKVALQFDGAEQVKLDASGSLFFRIDFADFRSDDDSLHWRCQPLMSEPNDSRLLYSSSESPPPNTQPMARDLALNSQQ